MFLALAVLGVLVFAVYSNSFHASWQFDDIPNIRDNASLRLERLSTEGIRRALHAHQKAPDCLYRPVACLSFALNYFFGGLDVRGYHLVNIAIHFLSASFLFLFVFQCLNLPSLRPRYGPRSCEIALLTALLWAIHPLQTQAVT